MARWLNWGHCSAQHKYIRAIRVNFWAHNKELKMINTDACAALSDLIIDACENCSSCTVSHVIAISDLIIDAEAIKII